MSLFGFQEAPAPVEEEAIELVETVSKKVKLPPASLIVSMHHPATPPPHTASPHYLITVSTHHPTTSYLTELR